MQSNPFKVLIGTMYAGENDFFECVEMIKAQKSVDAYHYVVSGKNEYDAHCDLYEKWHNNKSDYEFFVKVDADMILRDENVIYRMCKEMLEYSKSGYKAISCPLYDFFLDDYIHGMHCYIQADDTFKKPASRVFCDALSIHRKEKVIEKQSESKYDLYPCGYHCKNPSKVQSFMWGYHRGTKNRDVKKKLQNSQEKNPHYLKEIAIFGYDTGAKNPNSSITPVEAEEYLLAYRKI